MVIGGYLWLLIAIILMNIGDYSIIGYWSNLCLLIVIILMAIADYYINGYW
jgi:hypothetical protein